MIILNEKFKSTASQTVCNTQEYTEDINLTYIYKVFTLNKEFC